jgi:hypothetical protein
MKLRREWVTPLAIGTFVLTAVTGMLMFFHLDSGLNKVVHEWLSWLLVVGVGLHALVNWSAFRRHLQNRPGQWVIGCAALVLAFSFIPAGADGEPPFLVPARALASTPITQLATVAGTSVDAMRTRLARQGVSVAGDNQSLRDLVGDDMHRQVAVLAAVLKP